MLTVRTEGTYSCVHIYPEKPMFTHVELHTVFTLVEKPQDSDLVIDRELLMFSLPARSSLHVVSQLDRHVSFSFWRLDPATYIYHCEGQGACRRDGNILDNASPVNLLVAVHTELPQLPRKS